MARVPTDPVASVGPSDQGTPYQSEQATPASFGAGIGQAVQGLGQAGQGAADTAVDIARQQAQLHNQIAVNDAFNKLEQGSNVINFGDPSNPGDKGFYGLRGEDALRAYPDKLKALQGLRDTLSSGLSNPRQQLLFDTDSRRMQSQNEREMGAHHAAQMLTWGDQTAQAAQQIQVRNAGLFYNSDDRFNAALADGLKSIGDQAHVNGWSVEQVQAKADELRSQMQTARIQRMAEADPVAAKAYLAAHAGDLDTRVYAAMNEHLQGAVDKVQSEGVAQGIVGGNPVPRYTPKAKAVAPVDPSQQQGLLQQAVAGTPIPTALLGAVVQQESGWDAGARRDGGTDRGLTQVVDSTARNPGYGMQGVDPSSLDDPAANLRFGAQYLYARGKAAGLSDADWSNPARVAVALRSYNGGGDPRYAQHVMAHMHGALSGGGGAGLPPSDATLALQLDQVRQASAEQGLSFEAQRRAESLVMANHARQQALGAGERQDLHQSMQDLIPALEQGMDADIPEQRIRAAFPPNQADRMMMELNVSKQAGQLYKGAQFMSPDQEQQARSLLETPGTVQADGIRVRRGQLAGPGMNPVPASADGSVASPAANPEDPTAMRLRTQVAQRFEALLARKHAALAADPAAYAATSPDVQQASQAVKPGDPQSWQSAVAASVGLQRQLGVPESGLRILTNDQAGGMVAKIVRTDPAQADVGQELDKVSQQYGPMWPQVFGELVSQGKLPRDYQMLAAMDTPAQAGARVDFQRMLSAAAQKGGVKELAAAAPPDAVKAIKQGLDDAVDQFRQTARYNDGGVQLVGDVRDSMEHLATYYAMQGASGASALEQARQGILGRYDFDGSMRVPKGMLPAARQATQNALGWLRPEDLGTVQGNQALTPAERETVVLAGARVNPLWVPNKDDSGLVLMTRLRNGAAPITLRRGDGSPVEVRFADMARSVPPPGAGTAGTPFQPPPAAPGAAATTAGPAAPGGT